jgi:hypothetical protein
MSTLMGEIEQDNEEGHQSVKQFSSHSKRSENKKDSRGMQQVKYLKNESNRYLPIESESSNDSYSGDYSRKQSLFDFWQE